MKQPVITCEKYLSDFMSSLNELNETIADRKKNGHSEKTDQKLLRLFEITHELALNTIMEYFKKQGRKPYSGSRDATIDAFHEELIDDGEGWLDMIIFRIKATPVYSEDVSQNLVEKIIKKYISLLENFGRKMSQKLDNE